MKVSIRHLIIYIVLCILSTFSSFGQTSVKGVDTLLTVARSIPQDKIDEYRSQKEYNYELNPKYENNWIERFLNWLDKYFEGSDGDVSAIGWFFKLLYWLILIGAVGALVYYILLSRGHNVFARGNKAKAKIEGDLVDENTSMQSIDELIATAERNSDYALAIRLHYLKTLRLLDDKKYILWKSGKTNHEYISEIEDENKRNKFDTLSYIYEYSWYGKFNILDDQQYEQLKEPFIHYFNQIS